MSAYKFNTKISSNIDALVGSLWLDVGVSPIYIIHISNAKLRIKYAMENSYGILMIVWMVVTVVAAAAIAAATVSVRSHIDVNLFLNSVRICITRIEIAKKKRYIRSSCVRTVHAH